MRKGGDLPRKTVTSETRLKRLLAKVPSAIFLDTHVFEGASFNYQTRTFEALSKHSMKATCTW